MMNLPDYQAGQSGNLTWGYELDPETKIEDPALLEAWQRAVIRRMVARRVWICVHEGQLVSCPKLIQWAREEHARLHPTWKPLQVWLSINQWGLRNIDRPKVDYFPFQSTAREECQKEGWFLKVDNWLAEFPARWFPMILFDVRIPAFRTWFVDQVKQRFLSDPDPANRPDGVFGDETNGTGTAIGPTGRLLPGGWSEGATLLAKGQGGLIQNGSLPNIPTTRGRFLQNAERATVAYIKEAVYALYRPRMINILDFYGNPLDPAAAGRAAARAALVDAYWGLHRGNYDDDVASTVARRLTDGTAGPPAEYAAGSYEPVYTADGGRLFKAGRVTGDLLTVVDAAA